MIEATNAFVDVTKAVAIVGVASLLTPVGLFVLAILSRKCNK